MDGGEKNHEALKAGELRFSFTAATSEEVPSWLRRYKSDCVFFIKEM